MTDHPTTQPSDDIQPPRTGAEHSRTPAALVTLVAFTLAAAPGVGAGAYALGSQHSRTTGAAATGENLPSAFGPGGVPGSGDVSDASGQVGPSGSAGSDGPADQSGSATELRRAADGSLLSGTRITSSPGVVLIDTTVDGGRGEGTGMVLTSDGQVLTNYHVVEGSTSVAVVDSVTRRKYTATVVGHDATHDLAVLRLKDASNLQTVTVSQSAAKVGDSVTAIGQGGGQGVLYKTSGVVTALDRSITAGDDLSATTGERLTGLLQTSADVVPGYSGGPLVDGAGRVVGIDTAASSGTEIDGYAVPVSQAMAIARQIVAGTRTADVHIGPRAALGVQVGAGAHGAEVAEVVPGGGADRAGIPQGATITSVDEQAVAGAAQLRDELGDDYPGTRVTIGWTDPQGDDHRTQVTLGTSTVN